MKILFVTVNRSDYGIWRPILRLLKASKLDAKIAIFATGGHLSKKHGETISEIENDQLFDKLYSFPCTVDDDSALGSVESMAKIPNSLGFSINDFLPEMVFILGDRYEALAAALSVSFFRIPIVHFHGGSITEGAMDDNFRHAITKLSHYHFVECQEFKKRLIQLGEDEKNIFISGAPSLNALKEFKPSNLNDFRERFLQNKKEEFILATLHSETTKSSTYNKRLAQNFFACMNETNELVLVTAPNPDPHYNVILKEIEKSRNKNPNKYIFVPHLGHIHYFDALYHCKFVMGNSSSGIIEASSFKKLTLNIGERQKNRAHDRSVIHCDISKVDIKRGLIELFQHLNDPNTFLDWDPIYQNKNSEEIILRFFEITRQYYQKKFFDMQ